MRLAWLITDVGGCGHFRAQMPCYCLQEHGWDVTAHLLQPNIQMCSGWFDGLDAVIGQRLAHRGMRKLLDAIPPEHRPALIYECDDLLTELDHVNPAHDEYAARRNRILATISECDGLIVSTEELARRLSREVSHAAHGICPPTTVVVNYIDFGIRRWGAREPRLTSHFVIGWQGACSHIEDWRPAASAITEVLTLRPGVAFACCSTPEMIRAWRQALPEVSDSQFLAVPPAEFREFPSRISQFDVGIAPLQDTPFNRCRSDLKLLEYGAYGLPWVASDLPPYNSHQIGGFLPGSRTEWVDGLMTLVDDQETREALGAAWRGYVYQQRGIARCGPAWAAAIGQIVEVHRASL